ncbi:hypothetical protein DRW07_02645 [Alteromonas sediminis]|uniref:KfrA N-terminal DNA-binding domain-containing protein n=1 Tax=Alteromonas sediminis TaxID=2259342 RepID=A0A3N5YEQ7_9ALTE|nr:hypothetical protein [Alteromonas sediminis]RPJ68325.1 hypothetical protein DRW07_02645 [Alteromonas sediminis]
MSDSNQLLALCYELDAKGITPSVGLVRARTTGKVSLQSAIKAVQQFKDGIKPTAVKEDAAPPQAAPSSLENRVDELESQVRALLLRVETLEKRAD